MSYTLYLADEKEENVQKNRGKRSGSRCIKWNKQLPRESQVTAQRHCIQPIVVEQSNLMMMTMLASSN